MAEQPTLGFSSDHDLRIMGPQGHGAHVGSSNKYINLKKKKERKKIKPESFPKILCVLLSCWAVNSYKKESFLAENLISIETILDFKYFILSEKLQD